MKYVLITDDNVKELYGKGLAEHLNIELLSFPAGESSKTRAVKEKLENDLFSRGYNRDTTIIALGGGVVTDLVGFLASTFCRGVDLVLIPTTLMGIVDASIGGKNGVNTSHGKNMIGSIYFPKSVVVHLGFLSTLPSKEWFNGAVEMLKAGLIADRDYFEGFSTISLEKSIARAVEIKRRILSLDPFETGFRRILNFGHTIGHALETVSNYQISHGEAVAAGIVLESQIAHEMGFLKTASYHQIKDRFPPVAIRFEPEAILHALRSDKKAAGGSPRFVLLKEIGDPLECGGAYCREVPLEIITQVLHDAALCSC